MLWEFSEEFFTAFPQNAVSNIHGGYVVRVYIESLKSLHKDLSSLGFQGNYYICNHKELRIRFGVFERFFTHKYVSEAFPLDHAGYLDETIDLGPLEPSQRHSIVGNFLYRCGPIPLNDNIQFSLSDHLAPAFHLRLKTSGKIHFHILQQEPFPPPEIREECIHPSLRPHIHNVLKQGNMFFMNLGGKRASTN